MTRIGMVLFVLMGVLNHLHMPMVCKVSRKELEKETGNATRENVFDINENGPCGMIATNQIKMMSLRFKFEVKK